MLNSAAELGNLSCGFLRDTFYRYLASAEDSGIEALIDANHPNPKNRVEEVAETAVAAFVLEQLAF